ncbi:MAG: acyltransferase [Verrucomicrobiae bacterium]|nr:acyltransferase [Verrucomicrobiae bacterium]
MFGYYRFALAFFVTLYHLAGLHPVGWYSVYAFYALSGYLMTLVISKKYQLTPAGLFSFEYNRVLRIFPPYWIALIGALVLLRIPSFADAAKVLCTKPDIGMPATPFDWFQNVFIYGWRVLDPKLLPHCWSISRELIICSMVFFVFARWRWVALAWFAGSLLYAAYNIWQDKTFYDIYNSYKTGMLSYAAGCCIYHFRSALRRSITKPFTPLMLIAAALPFINEAIGRRVFADEHNPIVPFYINTLLSSFAILLLSTLRETKGWVAKLDNLLGNLSYPMFLVHWNVGILVSTFLPGPKEQSVTLFLVSLGPILLVAWIINRAVEQPLTPVRRKIFPTVRSIYLPALRKLGWVRPEPAPAPLAAPVEVAGPAE